MQKNYKPNNDWKKKKVKRFARKVQVKKRKEKKGSYVNYFLLFFGDISSVKIYFVCRKRTF